MILSEKTLAVLRGESRFYLWKEVADVAVKAAEFRGAAKNRSNPSGFMRFKSARSALDASLAALDAEASKHG